MKRRITGVLILLTLLATAATPEYLLLDRGICHIDAPTMVNEYGYRIVPGQSNPCYLERPRWAGWSVAVRHAALAAWYR